MISVKNLTKQYGNLHAIDNLSFEVERGEIVGLLGPNGAGKTTTMRILTGFMPATSGTAEVCGFDVFEASYEVKRRIGYLPEVPPLYPEMTVQEYLIYVATLKAVPKDQKSQAVSRVVEKCRLGEVQKRLIGHLSKGYQQRVGLAQALVHDPQVLILDEPTVGLDPKQILEIRSLIKDLAGGHTVILSTHILPEVTQMCRRIIIINEGKIVAVDTYDRLSSQLRKTDKVEIQLRNPQGALEKLKSIPGVIQVARDDQKQGAFLVECRVDDQVRDEISKVVVQNNMGLLEMRVKTVSLEDVFLKLTTEE
ncbi:MAG: ABC transporter ATP-binding protein [Deltaproteobacteria bacterium]|nr:ABC transporter ATP-binding protein [Deltaproteobacteria bacterium]MBI3017766.1 ABC transporter ATP-binding protein [Deltaproteobacteria bacterium]